MKISFYPQKLPIMIQLLRKSTDFDSKMLVCSNKELISKVESFLNSNFDLNQGYEILVKQNH